MACILKLPTNYSKGVISFTNIEYKIQIQNNNIVRQLISELKKNWIVAYHPNWQDLNFYNDGTFDCAISNKESFKFSLDSLNKNLIDTSSNRMSPNFFKMNENKKWDFCHVSRFQTSKNIDGFFRVVKDAITIKKSLTGILIISVKNKSEMLEIRNKYEKLFTKNEQENFEFITVSYNYPFPISKKTLGHFYSASKVTLNTHLNEPHGRVVGYAIASGLPVVGYEDLSCMVPSKYRVKPYFFISKEEKELSKLLIDAIKYVDTNYNYELHNKLSTDYSENSQMIFLKESLKDKFSLDDDGWNLYQLDLRLSTHYLCKDTVNTNNSTIYELLIYLNNHQIDKVDENSILVDIHNSNIKSYNIIQNKIECLKIKHRNKFNIKMFILKLIPKKFRLELKKLIQGNKYDNKNK